MVLGSFATGILTVLILYTLKLTRKLFAKTGPLLTLVNKKVAFLSL